MKLIGVRCLRYGANALPLHYGLGVHRRDCYAAVIDEIDMLIEEDSSKEVVPEFLSSYGVKRLLCRPLPV